MGCGIEYFEAARKHANRIGILKHRKTQGWNIARGKLKIGSNNEGEKGVLA